jgi:hypothetical protein
MRYALLCLAFLLSATAAQAQQITKVQAPEVDIQQYIDCPATQIWPDTSLVSHTYRVGNDTCLLYLIADSRFGIEWHAMSNSISITAGTAPLETVPENLVELDPVDIADTMKRCLRIGPRRKFIDEWLVPKGSSCENCGEHAGRHHHYVNDRVCLVGTFNCVPIALLRPEAKERVMKVFELAHKQSKAAASH